MSILKNILKKIESGGERVWRLNDFKDFSPVGVAQALSRLCRRGKILRIGKGLYYKPRQTVFGQSKPNISLLRSLPIEGKKIYPAGGAAAGLLGFSTQNAAKVEIATNGLSLPRLLVGNDTIIYTRRPESWREITCKDAAILDFLRRGGKSSELSPEVTVRKLIDHLRKPQQYERLLRVALTEPPRVRAMLGAIGQEIGYLESQLFALKKSLNSLSRFDFGILMKLKYAKQWQAKEYKDRETV